MNPLFLSRYQRQINLPQWGLDAQNRLAHSAVLIVGLGGLGCAVAPYLVSSGVGRVGLMDFDEVSLTNLHRQPLYTDADVGLSKVNQAALSLKKLNPHCQIETYSCPFNLDLDQDLSPETLNEYDCIVDCTDRLSARYDISRVCHTYNLVHIYGSVDQFEGQVAVFYPSGPCYQCMFPTPPPPGLIQNCAQSGVLGPLPGLIGTLQALETLKVLGNLSSPQKSSTQISCFDGLTTQLYSLPLHVNPRCPICSLSIQPPSMPSQESSTKVHSKSIRLITSIQLKKHLSQATLSSPSFQIIDVRSPEEYQEGHLPTASLWPLSDLQTQIVDSSTFTLPPSFDPHHPTVIYCAQGPRAQKALSLLTPYFSSLYELVGGWDGWLEIHTQDL